MACNLNTVCWMWILTCAMALPAAKLNMYLGDIDDLCWPEGRVFDTFGTIYTAINYATAYTNGQLTPTEIGFNLNVVPGCGMSEAKHIYTLICFLRNAQFLASSSTGYSVFVGPRLGSNCHFITDWIALGAVSSEAHRNLYQISYLCQDVESFRSSEKLQPGHTRESTEETSFAVNLKDHTLIQSLRIFLRQNSWKNIVVLFEASPLVLTYSALAQNLDMYLSRTASGREGLNVATVHNLQLNSDPREIVERFCNPCEGKLHSKTYGERRKQMQSSVVIILFFILTAGILSLF